MSTELYHLRVLDVAAPERRARLRVFNIDWDEEGDEIRSRPLADDPSFFMRVLWEVANDLDGPLAAGITLDEFLDEDWIDTNTWRYVERVERLVVRNEPFTAAHVARDDAAMASSRAGNQVPSGTWGFDSWAGDEESLLQADYDVWVTDPRWLHGLFAGATWGTTCYPTAAVHP
jgi:hypothetical protein